MQPGGYTAPQFEVVLGDVMKLRLSAVLLAAAVLAGCGPEMRWQRADGGPVYGYAFDRAMAECRGRSMNADEAAAHIMRRCMERRGFVWGSSSGGY